MATRYIIATFLLLAATFAGSFAYAQESGMRDSTSGGSVDVMVTPIWSPNDTDPTKFEVKFLKPGTDTIQEHIDYTFVIKKDGQEVFNAAPPGQALLHTVEGVTIPYKFEGNGDYSIEISVDGINFVPISPENVTFGVHVTPEFPAGAFGVAAGLVGTVAALSRRFKF
jgi:hypothetical protein